MVDLSRTFKLITGTLFDAEATWRGYLPEAGDWQKTAFLLTGPLIVLSAVLGYVIGLLGSDVSVLGLRPTIVSTLVGIVASAVAIGVVSFALAALAGVFGGRNSFPLGLATASLAFVPGYLGQALGWLPWIGSLVAIALFVYALILLWRIIPIYLEVPDAKRAGHYILSLVSTIVVMFLVSMLLRPVLGPDLSGMGVPSATRSSSEARSGMGGIVGGAMRQAELMAAAEDDRYDPPSDGELDEGQVEEFIRVMQRAQEIARDKGERLRELSERAERDEQLSLSEMSEVMSGATEVMGLNTIELEVVKSGGGNWAEHQWVKESLRTAYVQRDIGEAVKHNYELYQDYEDELKPFVSR